jgi:hypothetical protein
MSNNEPPCGGPREAQPTETQAPGPCAAGIDPGACCGPDANEKQAKPWAALAAWCGCGTSERKDEASPPEMI